MQRVIRILPYAVVAGFAIWCVRAFQADISQISLRPIAHAWDTVGIVALLSLANYAVRAIRWRWYLARLGYPYPLGLSMVIFVSGFAFTLAPGKLGEMVRARYYTPAGVPLTAVAAAFFAERLLDLLATVALACLIFTMLGHFQVLLWVGTGVAVATACVVGLEPGAVSAAWRRMVGRLPPRLAAVAAGAAQTARHASTLLQPPVLAAGFALALIAWGAEGFGFGLLAAAVEPHRLAMAHAVGIYATAVLAGALSFLPGGLGTTEAVMSVLLVARGFPVGEAMLVTLACRVLTLWLAAALGWVAMGALRLEPRVAYRWQ